MNKRRVAGVVIGIVLIALIAGGYGYYRSQQDQPLTLYGNVDIRTVNLGFRVSGRLASLTVDEGAAVKPGMLLGRLDDAPYVNALNEARAAAAAAQANLALLQAGYRSEEIAQAQAAVVQAEANYRYMQSFYERQQGLWASRAVSANELESARTNRNQAQAQLQQARDRLAQYQSGNRPQQIEQAQAQLQQAQAQVAQAELNLHDTALFAPSRGTVMTRAVEPGTGYHAGRRQHGIQRRLNPPGLGTGLHRRDPPRSRHPRYAHRAVYRWTASALSRHHWLRLPHGRIHAEERRDAGSAHLAGLSSARDRRRCR